MKCSVFAHIGMIILLLLLSLNGNCQLRKSAPDTINWRIDVRRVYFETSGNYYPFTLKIRNDAWFVRTPNDIIEGFVDFNKQESIFEIGFAKKGRIVRVNGNPYNHIEKIDTIRSSFNSELFNKSFLREPEKTKCIDFEVNILSRELEYSYLIQKIKLDEMPLQLGQNKIRIIYPIKSELYFQRIHIIEVVLSNEKPEIFFLDFNTANALDFPAVNLKNAHIDHRHLKRIYSLIKTIDLNHFRMFDNYKCVDPNSMKKEFLIEINWMGKYYYGVFCHTWRDLKIDKIDNQAMEDVLTLKSELITLMNKNKRKLN